MKTLSARFLPRALVLAGVLALAPCHSSGAAHSIELLPLPALAVANGAPEAAAPAPAASGEIIQLGPNVRMPRAVFEGLSPEERMVLLRGIGEAERSANWRKALIATVFVIAVIAAVFVMYLGEKRRLEAVRILAQRGEPLPEKLAAALARGDPDTGGGGGFRSSNGLGNLLGGLMWIGFGVGAIVIAHLRTGKIGAFWAFAVFIVVGIGYIIAEFRKPAAKA